ncbi:hypothetical protein CL614_05770 [archaeon]|jgi:hypothetical protein|nr:hypothetical protein [archaeon]|tara:strand:+ start:1398 stop:1721 length:324 start_codon:yes stop_codon:yes gene_type:complete
MPYKDIEKKRICDKEYQRKKRIREKDKILKYNYSYRDKFPERYSAHKKVFRAIKAGKLKRSACKDCDSLVSIQGHHSDYSKPLEVIWLCSPCHKKLHIKLINKEQYV